MESSYHHFTPPSAACGGGICEARNLTRWVSHPIGHIQGMYPLCKFAVATYTAPGISWVRRGVIGGVKRQARGRRYA